jgi:methionyl-tRNA synthetase
MSLTHFYIATAIPYVNDKPHIGHAMDFVYADVLARYERLRGATVLFNIGNDEHGLKIAEKAAEQSMSPKAFSDAIVTKWEEFARSADVSYDRFIRTTSAEHETRAAIIWKNLSEHIYKGSYEGLYCVGCETFYTESVAKENDGVCPHHNRQYDHIKEENYFFALSSFTAQVRAAIESGQMVIIPASRRNEIMNVLKGGLEDISISRPKEKVGWGIPVPGDPAHTMYVWFDALMNYITTLGYPDGADFKTFWPANVQVIGKDILRFHAAIWPAMLLGLGLPLPKVLYVHGHVSSEGKKMSKTLGNVIDPIEVIGRHGVDAFRYYLLRHIPSHDDGDFSFDRFETAYNSELANELGNSAQRVAAMAVKYLDGVLGDIPEGEHDQGEYHEAIAHCRFDRAMDEIWEQIRGLNQYIDTTKPWEIVKTGDQAHIREVLAYCVSCLNEVATMLAPFLPTTAAAIEAMFKDGIVTMPPAPLFPRSDSV